MRVRNLPSIKILTVFASLARSWAMESSIDLDLRRASCSCMATLALAPMVMSLCKISSLFSFSLTDCPRRGNCGLHLTECPLVQSLTWLHLTDCPLVQSLTWLHLTDNRPSPDAQSVQCLHLMDHQCSVCTSQTINTASSLDGPSTQCLQTQRRRRSVEDINASYDQHHSCLQHFCTPRSCMRSYKPQSRPTGGRYIREIGKKKVQIRLRNAAGFVCRCFCAVCWATEKQLTLARSVCAVCRAKENADCS